MQELDKKVFGDVIKFIINTAIFTTFFAILFDPVGKNMSVLSIFSGLLKELGIGGGILCGIILFGTKDTASIASFVFLLVFIYKCLKNIEKVSNAAGPAGWFYIVFIIVGFMLQENIKFRQLVSDIVNMFSFGKKMAVVAGDSVDRSSDKGKSILAASTGISLPNNQKITENLEMNKLEIQKESV